MRKLLFLSLLILAFVVEASSGFPETVRSGFFTTAACRSVVLMQQNGRVFGKPVLYESACPSSDGFIAVKSNGRWSYLDCATGQILRAGLTDASRFRGGVARIKDEQGWAFLFTDGRELDLAGEYSYVGIPKDGLCSVVMDGKVGFIDHEGKIVIPPKFDVPFGRDGREHLNLLWFNEGYCIVREGSAQFFINPEA
ncbi:MAG: WG repeat-containing protein [Planctomycetota bacterium]|nr:WG repeat-containing protein [Planctomycetota bacterium]